jgi:hypothetical protein
LIFTQKGRIIHARFGPTRIPYEVTVIRHESARSNMAALYRRVADTLERSAQLAEEHAERDRSEGRLDAREIASAKRAREAATRARDLASYCEEAARKQALSRKR